ncbi:uncharacterized protein LOC134706745 [Mytilus trossulus]|uniref:uncharacterized protein LOC134706745 n=1 Tax=Mytilus trossulus TaxID=6551 RepID=UPI00300730CA
MASSEPIPCGPCQEGQLKTKADIWCYNCDEGLCSTCSGHHKRFKGTCDHKTVDIKSYKPSIHAIKTECDKHGQQLILYCPRHAKPCCDECISEIHSKCTGIKSFASVVEKTIIEKSKESVERDINSILHILDKILNNKSTNIKIREKQYEGTKESMVKLRIRMNKYLDCLEEKFDKETDNLWDKEKSAAKDFISEVEGKKKTLKEIKEHLHIVTTNSSKNHSVLGVHQLEQQIHQYQQYVDDLENDDRAKEFYITMTQNDDIKKIVDQLGLLKSIGEVTVVTTQSGLTRVSRVRMKAEVESQEQFNISNMTMNIQASIEVNIGIIRDMVCLMDGKVIVVVDEVDKVDLFNSDGKLEKQLPLSGDAWDVTQINQNTIAITYPRETAIKIFNMENETVTKVIPLDKVCKGLSFSNNSLAVGLNVNDDREIRIVDLKGYILQSIQVQSKSFLDDIVYCIDRIIFTDYVGKAVNCFDISGQQLWQCSKDLTSPWGLCTDTYDNICVADNNSDSVIVISKDGKNSKVLISKEDGLEDGLMNPMCICFKQNESFGFICNGIHLTKYSLSWK